MKKIALLVLMCIVSIGSFGCQPPSPTDKRMLPHDPTFDAVYERLGNPDRMTGSGRSFLHYDLKNGQTLTLVVSGDMIIGSEVTEKE